MIDHFGQEVSTKMKETRLEKPKPVVTEPYFDIHEVLNYLAQQYPEDQIDIYEWMDEINPEGDIERGTILEVSKDIKRYNRTKLTSKVTELIVKEFGKTVRVEYWW